MANLFSRVAGNISRGLSTVRDVLARGGNRLSNSSVGQAVGNVQRRGIGDGEAMLSGLAAGVRNFATGARDFGRSVRQDMAGAAGFGVSALRSLATGARNFAGGVREFGNFAAGEMAGAARLGFNVASPLVTRSANAIGGGAFTAFDRLLTRPYTSFANRIEGAVTGWNTRRAEVANKRKELADWRYQQTKQQALEQHNQLVASKQAELDAWNQARPTRDRLQAVADDAQKKSRQASQQRWQAAATNAEDRYTGFNFLRDSLGYDQDAVNVIRNRIQGVEDRKDFTRVVKTIYNNPGIDDAALSKIKGYDSFKDILNGTPAQDVNDSMLSVIRDKGALNREKIAEDRLSNMLQTQAGYSADDAKTAIAKMKENGMGQEGGKTVRETAAHLSQKYSNAMQGIDHNDDEAFSKILSAMKSDSDVGVGARFWNAGKEAATKKSEVAPVGSGKTLSEGKQSLLTTNKDGTVSLNEAGYNELADNDPSFWGYKGARQHHIKGVNERIAEYNKSIQDKTPEEIAALRKTFEDKLTEDVKGGYGVSDWIFGNQLHTGAVGAAAIMGTMGVAFGGHRSNADLYSSPF